MSLRQHQLIVAGLLNTRYSPNSWRRKMAFPSWVCVLLFLTISVTLVDHAKGLECLVCTETNVGEVKIDLSDAGILGIWKSGDPRKRTSPKDTCDGRGTQKCVGKCATTHIRGKDDGGYYFATIRECFPSDSEALFNMKDKDCKDFSYLIAKANSKFLHSVEARTCVCKEDECNKCLAEPGDGGKGCKDKSPCGGSGAKILSPSLAVVLMVLAYLF